MPNLSIPRKKNTLLIGVTGHRDLLPKDWRVQLTKKGELEIEGYLIPFVKNKLEALQQAHSDKHLLLLTGMAKGADLLVTWVAQQLETPIPFIAILATDQKTYLANLTQESEAESVLCSQLLAKLDKEEQLVICKPTPDGPDYREVGMTIARYADDLLALWNGVDTGKPGGTWEVVRMARTGRDMAGKQLDMFRNGRNVLFRLHHLLTPRQDSPYPLPRFFNLTSLQSLLPLGTSYSWVELSDKRRRAPAKNWWALIVEHRNEILKPGIPFLLFCITMTLATRGLLDYDDYVTAYEHLLKTNPVEAAHRSHLIAKDYHHLSCLGAFYKALHFETVFPPTYDGLASDVSTQYVWGKYMGMLFYLYAGVLVALKLMGDMGRRLWIRTISRIGGSFSLLLGLNERSYATLSSLRARRKRVVALESKPRSPFYISSQQRGAIVINASPEEPNQLRSIRFYRANEVFLLGENDTTNLHIVQQMDRMLIERGQSTVHSDWYVQVQNIDKRRFLNRFTHQLPNVHIYSFNLYENMARRLLVQYPIDRFYRNPQADTTHVFILGFGELGKQIAQNCLRLGHFKAGRKLQLTIFTAKPEEQEKAWKRQYPFLKCTAAPFDSHKLAEELSSEVFGHLSVEFLPLPETDFELLSDNFPLYKLLDPKQPGQIISLYCCLSDEFKSAAYLSSLLDRLNMLQKQQVDQNKTPTDIQLFCYYSFPNEEETALVEQRFNELAPHIPVICFGSVQQEFAIDSLRERALDKMAQLTALYYDEVIEVYNKQANNKAVSNEEISKKEQWSSADTNAFALMNRAIEYWPGRLEMDKESNRILADHAFIKLREAWEHLLPEARQASGDTTQLAAQDLKNWLTNEQDARDAMSQLEHRRWCAEKLVDGWVPLLSDEKEIAEMADFWRNKTAFKKLSRSQKRHLDLVPDRILKTLLGKEYHKDTQLIEAIPVLVEILRKLSQPS